MDLGTSADLPNRFPMTSVENHARDTEDFDVGERVASVYGMAEFYVGLKLLILPGVRYEHTSSEFVGNAVSFSPNGAWLATTPIAGDDDYGTVLPGVNVRYAATPTPRTSASRSRDRWRDPITLILCRIASFNDSDNTVGLGNSSLRPTLAWNVDAMFEHYLKSVGVLLSRCVLQEAA